LDKAIDYVEKESVDLCFLDLNLSGQNGFQLIEKSKQDFQTIITSAYTEKAIDAFHLGVLDFVPKPFQKERVKKAINRYLVKHQTKQQALMVQCQQNQKVLPLSEISFKYTDSLLIIISLSISFVKYFIIKIIIHNLFFFLIIINYNTI